MNIELEAKVKVPDHNAVLERLAAVNAQPLDTVTQVDIYYDFSDGRLLNADSGLRIRYEAKDSSATTVLCYKGPRQAGPFKKREELETQVSNLESLKTILDRLDFVIRLTIEKKRQHWRMNNCLICLDTVKELGCFIEIEGPDESTIRQVLGQLDLTGLEYLRYGYARMMSEHLTRNQSGR